MTLMLQRLAVTHHLSAWRVFKWSTQALSHCHELSTNDACDPEPPAGLSSFPTCSPKAMTEHRPWITVFPCCKQCGDQQGEYCSQSMPFWSTYPPTPNQKTAQHRGKRAIKVPFYSANPSTALFNSQIRTSKLLLNHPAVLYRSQSFVLEEPVICHVQFPRTKKLPLENVLQLLYQADSPAYFYQWIWIAMSKAPSGFQKPYRLEANPHVVRCQGADVRKQLML